MAYKTVWEGIATSHLFTLSLQFIFHELFIHKR